MTTHSIFMLPVHLSGVCPPSPGSCIGGFVQRKGLSGKKVSSRRIRKEKERETDGKKENGEERRKKGRKMQGKWRKEDSSVASKSKQMDEHGSSGAGAQLGEGITAQHCHHPRPPSRI